MPNVSKAAETSPIDAGKADKFAVAPSDSAVKAVAGRQQPCFAGEKVGWVGRIDSDTFLPIVARALCDINVWADSQSHLCR